jgi:hypothetical protein
MNIRIGFLALGLGMLTMATAAQAFTIDPQCQGVDDQIGCTCAVQNGGYVKSHHGTVHWYSPKFDRTAYSKCLKDNGAQK